MDLEGRLIGILHIWNPGQHGRNSGIGFLIPWDRVLTVLEEMKGGRTFARPLLGISWDLKQKPGGGFDMTGQVS